MNRRGQALVEFVLILPVFLMILFVIVDFGNISSNKSRLENISASIVDMYKSGDSIDNIKDTYSDVSIEISGYSDKYTRIVIFKKIDLITPGLGRIIDDPFLLKNERIVGNV